LPDPDKQLVEACQGSTGEDFEEAYRQLFALYQDRVYSICLRVTGNAEDALDAAQETMVTLARRVQGFAFRSRFSSWVYRIAVNAAIDTRRRRLDAPRGAVRTTFGGGEEERQLEQATANSVEADPVGAASRQEAQALLQDALTRINPKVSALLVLRYVEGLSYDQIAETLEISLGTVKSRLNRAHATLREFLHHQGLDSLDPTP
jgi:RNA polymerase sigma-70 factor (ECF subfamily)